MTEAPARFGISTRMLNIIPEIYATTTFQTHGIDQGCPLSPYLCIILLSVFLEDVEVELRERGIPSNTWSEGHPVADLEYADDTLLLALTMPQLQAHLSALEDMAAEYGMSLNKGKTELLIY